MKKFMQLIAAVKAVAALAFTAEIMLATVVSMLFGKDGVPVGYIWQMMFLALIYGCIQLVVFSDHYFPQMKTPGRILLLGASMFAVLAAFAVLFQWFPVTILSNWFVFIGVYVAVFLIAVFALRTVFRLSGVKYTQMLAAYQANHDSD